MNKQKKILAKSFRKEIAIVWERRHRDGLNWTRHFVADRIERIRKLER